MRSHFFSIVNGYNGIRVICPKVIPRLYHKSFNACNIVKSHPLSKILLGKESFAAWKNAVYSSKNFCAFARRQQYSDNGQFAVSMSGIPYEATTEDICNFFKPLNVSASDVEVERNSMGRLSGRATVRFKSSEEVLEALRKDKEYIGHRYILLTPKNNFALSLKESGESLNPSEQEISEDSSAMESSKTGYRVNLRGLPYSATKEDIKNFFAPLNITPIAMKFELENGRPRGMCDVFFSSKDDAFTSLKNEKKYIGHRFVQMSFKGLALLPLPANSDESLSQSERKNFEESFAVENAERNYKVNLRGLPYEATEEDIKNFFAPLNIVPTSIEFKQRNGLPSGICDVVFSSDEEVQIALKNDKKYIGHRYIDVRMSNYPL